jgi:hypothetical protein
MSFGYAIELVGIGVSVTHSAHVTVTDYLKLYKIIRQGANNTALIYNGNVPASRGIRLHVGNTVASSSGCILVGMGRDVKQDFITESKLAETMVTMLCRNVDRLVICEEG